jgi:hypothetical protein
MSSGTGQIVVELSAKVPKLSEKLNLSTDVESRAENEENSPEGESE